MWHGDIIKIFVSFHFVCCVKHINEATENPTSYAQRLCDPRHPAVKVHLLLMSCLSLNLIVYLPGG